ncbi:MAG: DUF5107 domain-containing protein [Clostridia bacterium]|nr:DUF5107 domain-containing protein [Clostridia bacterium]
MSTLTVERYTMPSASLGADNPLPEIKKNADAHADIAVDREMVSEEESKYMGWGRVNGILPYTIHNNYNRTKRPHAWKSVVLENDHIRATFLPELGARLWSLVDKHTGKELLHCNPVFQPCNLALRNAWISGGVEWNLGIIGHTPFTVDSLYAERLSLSDGTPVVRFYQYERVRHLVYRVEAALPDDSPVLFVRVRIDNAGDEDTAVYWWSNMAVNEKKDVRVLVPAERAYRWGYGGKLTKVPVPYSDVFKDISYTMNLPQAMDYFFDIPAGQRRWIAALNGKGYGFCQSSTDRLIGRKLFVWGMGAGGRHWQEFLSQPGSAYIEIQAGLAHTQLEHLPMPGGETISWLETYGPMQADPKLVHGEDWQMATGAVNAKLESLISTPDLNAMHEKMAAELDGQNGSFLHSADGWGYVEQQICGEKNFRCGALRFPARRMGEAEKEWMALLNDGALPCPDPAENPKGYQVNDRWLKLLKKSIKSGKGDHWYANYQLGVMLAYRNDVKGAKSALGKSIKQAPSPWALRCLAVLAAQDDDLKKAGDLMLKALEMSARRNLAQEAVAMLCKGKRYKEALNAIDRLPESVKRIGRMKVLRIEALLGTGDAAQAEKLLRRKIVLTDVREGELSLTQLWFWLCALKKAQAEGGEVTEALIKEMSETVTPPAHLDFRMR